MSAVWDHELVVAMARAAGSPVTADRVPGLAGRAVCDATLVVPAALYLMQGLNMLGIEDGRLVGYLDAVGALCRKRRWLACVVHREARMVLFDRYRYGLCFGNAHGERVARAAARAYACLMGVNSVWKFSFPRSIMRAASGREFCSLVAREFHLLVIRDRVLAALESGRSVCEASAPKRKKRVRQRSI
jgi:hypothetical protein